MGPVGGVASMNRRVQTLELREKGTRTESLTARAGFLKAFATTGDGGLRVLRGVKDRQDQAGRQAMKPSDEGLLQFFLRLTKIPGQLDAGSIQAERGLREPGQRKEGIQTWPYGHFPGLLQAQSMEVTVWLSAR